MPVTPFKKLTNRISNFTDKMNKSMSFKGREYEDFQRKEFIKKHGEGKRGLDYAQGYSYDPSSVEKILDKLPGIGGKRAYDRAGAYSQRVHNTPENVFSEARKKERGINIAAKLKSDYFSINDKSVDDRFSVGAISSASEDPRVFTYTQGQSNFDKTSMNSSIYGSTTGHQAQDGERVRSIDPYNISTMKAGKKLLGIFPSGYKGKVSSNVAGPGKSKINPYINPESLKKQIMGNKNLAIADDAFYSDKKTWDAKKNANKEIEKSHKRWASYGK